MANTPYWLVMADDLLAESLERDVTKAAECLADAAEFVVEEFLERYADNADQTHEDATS